MSTSKNTPILKYFGVLVIFLAFLFALTSSNKTSPKDKVVYVDPGSIEYLSNTFDYLLVFFLA